MIKITPTGTSAVLTCGLKPMRKKKDRGRLGEGAKDCLFRLGPAELDAHWKDDRLAAEMAFESDAYVREVSLSFRYRSPKPKSATAVWTEAYSAEPQTKKRRPGWLTKGRSRSGAWGFWLSESHDSEGIFFRMSPKAPYPVLFRVNTSSRTLSVTWKINRDFAAGEKAPLTDVGLKRGPLRDLVNSWRREWKNASSRDLPSDRRRGWFDTGEAGSPKELREILAALRSGKVLLDWYALGPGYASATGDWLVPNERFRDRMGGTSRSISEHGFVPGIRFAPFLASRKSELAKKNREWLVKGAGGSPVTVAPYGADGEKCNILDPSHPDAAKHVERMLLAMRDQWGFRAFFADRMGDVSAPGIRASNEDGSCGLLEKASSLIRSTLGNRVLLAASDIPLLAAPSCWDARTVSPAGITLSKRKGLISTTSALLHRAEWNGLSWINASGPVPVGLFAPGVEAAALAARDAVILASGLISFVGDPRTADEETLENLKASLEMFEVCRNGRTILAPSEVQGSREPLIVRNDKGWIALFNLSGGKRGVSLEKETLKASLGVTKSISAGDGAVFNSPEIHVGLTPWGHRLFRG